jgi:polar amino acid transport system substrate-binding protein
MAIKRIGFVAVIATSLLVLAGCAAAGPDNGVDQSKVDKTAQALLPATYLESGIEVASDIPYEPYEFYDADMNLTGFDVELGALIGQKLGTNLNFNVQAFDSIIASLESKKNDLILSSMTDTLERQAKVDFIDYQIAGSLLLVAKGNPEGITGPMDLCGKTAITQSGTIQINLYNDMSAACTTSGMQKINVITFPTAPTAYNALRANKGVAVLLDSFVIESAAAKSGNGEYFEVVSDPNAPNGYGTAFLGAATLKADTGLRDAIQAAINSLIADGQYATLLAKYDMTANGVVQASINGTTE